MLANTALFVFKELKAAEITNEQPIKSDRDGYLEGPYWPSYIIVPGREDTEHS